MTTDNSPDALADRLEEAALASLPFGSGELAQALAEANAVRRGEAEADGPNIVFHWGGDDELLGIDSSGWPYCREDGAWMRVQAATVDTLRPALAALAQASRDARIARAAEGLLAKLDSVLGQDWRDETIGCKDGDDLNAAWDRLVEAVEGGTGQGAAEAPGTAELPALAAEVRQACIRKMALERAESFERHGLDLPGDEDGNPHALPGSIVVRMQVAALRDFAALLAPPAPAEGGGE